MPEVVCETHDFRHPWRDHRAAYTSAMDLSQRSHRLFRRAIQATALVPAFAILLVLDPVYRTWHLGAWLAGYLSFLALLAMARRSPDRAPALIGLQSAAALGSTWVLATTTEGAMLVVVASQIALRASLPIALAAAAGQTAVFAWFVGSQRSIDVAVDAPIAWLAFQVFAILLTHVARSEAQGRAELVERNLQLLSTRQLLAERSRTAERLRLARDLHDGLGHHLTALSLNLEAASHLTGEAAGEHVRRARTLTRTLLDDVRATVSDERDARVEPMEAIRALVAGIEDPAVHVTGPDAVSVPDAAHAETLLRVVQEVVTNAIRHGQARNVWINVRQAPGRLEFEGRDDGLGASAWHDGNGLRGMRERVSLLGGSLDVKSAPGRGFEIQAHIPQPEPHA